MRMVNLWSARAASTAASALSPSKRVSASSSSSTAAIPVATADRSAATENADIAGGAAQDVGTVPAPIVEGAAIACDPMLTDGTSDAKDDATVAASLLESGTGLMLSSGAADGVATIAALADGMVIADTAADPALNDSQKSETEALTDQLTTLFMQLPRSMSGLSEDARRCFSTITYVCVLIGLAGGGWGGRCAGCPWACMAPPSPPGSVRWGPAH